MTQVEFAAFVTSKFGSAADAAFIANLERTVCWGCCVVNLSQITQKQAVDFLLEFDQRDIPFLRQFSICHNQTKQDLLRLGHAAHATYTATDYPYLGLMDNIDRYYNGAVQLPDGSTVFALGWDCGVLLSRMPNGQYCCLGNAVVKNLSVTVMPLAEVRLSDGTKGPLAAVTPITQLFTTGVSTCSFTVLTSANLQLIAVFHLNASSMLPVRKLLETFTPHTDLPYMFSSIVEIPEEHKRIFSLALESNAQTIEFLNRGSLEQCPFECHPWVGLDLSVTPKIIGIQVQAITAWNRIIETVLAETTIVAQYNQLRSILTDCALTDELIAEILAVLQDIYFRFVSQKMVPKEQIVIEAVHYARTHFSDPAFVNYRDSLFLPLISRFFPIIQPNGQTLA